MVAVAVAMAVVVVVVATANLEVQEDAAASQVSGTAQAAMTEEARTRRVARAAWEEAPTVVMEAVAVLVVAMGVAAVVAVEAEVMAAAVAALMVEKRLVVTATALRRLWPRPRSSAFHLYMHSSAIRCSGGVGCTAPSKPQQQRR